VKDHRIPDARIADEMAALDAFIDSRRQDGDRRLTCMALGARCALEWVRDSKRADPMNPSRAITLLMVAFDIESPRVLPFTRGPDAM
jgi:hypothetical protein